MPQIMSIHKRHLLAQGGVSRFFASLNVRPVRLGSQKCSSLALNQNLPFVDGHWFDSETASLQYILRVGFYENR